MKWNDPTVKRELQSTTQRSEQLHILMILPTCWSLRKIQQEFGVTNCTASKIKKAHKRGGYFPFPAQNRILYIRNSWNHPCAFTSLIKLVELFLAIKIEGKCVYVQEWLVVNNLREANCEKFSARKVGFPKFAELWEQVVPFSVCVCTIHQDIKLKMYVLYNKIQWMFEPIT